MVCSAGGGRISQEFSRKCIEMVKDKRFADWKIDIILGNYSQLQWPYGQTEIYSKENVTIHRKLKDLYLLHASADCVICSGGYNSLVESMQGKDKTYLPILSWTLLLKKNRFIILEISGNIIQLQKLHLLNQWRI